MKQELINRLFDEFDKDKEVIKQNLMQVMETIVLEARTQYETLTMTIKYEKKEKEND